VWIVVGGFGLVIALMLFRRITPTDSAQVYREALAAGEAGNRELMAQRLEQLRTDPAYSAHVQFLDGLLFLGRSMPLKAIPLLRQAAENPELRSKALVSLGRAYGTAGQLEAAIQTLNSIADDPETGNQARFIACGMLATTQAWDAAVEQLRTLEKAGFETPKVLHQLAEIEFDRGNYADAEKLFLAAIEAFPTDPTNSMKATRLLDCRIQLGTLVDSDKYIDMLDNQITSSMYRAEALMAAGKIEEARTAIDRGMREAEGNPALSFLRGKLALAEKSVEAAKQVLPEVMAASVQFPRALDGMRVTAQVAELAGDADLADKARRNVEGLEAIRTQMRELMPAVSKSLLDVELRLQLAALARDCGDSDLMQKVFRGLMLFHPEREGEIVQRRVEMEIAPEMLVPFEREISMPINRGRVNESVPPGALLQAPPVPPLPPIRK
jgi:tetratricopeptide (TPR) repeat protein